MSGLPGGYAPPPPPPPPMEPGPSSPARTRSRRGRVIAAIVIVLVVVGAVVGTFAVSRHTAALKGPPSVPLDVRAKGSVCTPPDCHRMGGRVVVSWSPPSAGASVTGYDVFRDGVKITERPLAATDTSFNDHTTTFGISRRYEIVALSSEGGSERSAVATVKVPLPPDRFAQLSGLYTVHLTVVRASNLSKAEGIDNPAPGDTITEHWQLAPTCPSNAGPCAVKMGRIVLHPQGRALDGGSDSAGTANCLPSGSVPVHYSMHLVPARADDRDYEWVFTTFTGTRVLSFDCANGSPSSATFTLTAKYASSSAVS